MIKRIVLHGYLRDLVPGGVVELEAHTPREAVTLMCLHHRDAFRPNAISGRHTVQVRGYERPDDLDTVIAEEEIHLVPPFAAGKSAFIRILAGVVLIAAAFTPLGAVAIAEGVTLFPTLIGMGASLVLGGVLELLMPQPKIDTNADQVEASKYLGAPGNTVKIGTRIPIGFGRYKVYGHYLSYNVDATDFSHGQNTLQTGWQGGMAAHIAEHGFFS